MHSASWFALLMIQHAISSSAAPPPSSDAISTPTQSSSPLPEPVSAAAASSSPYYGYFRTVIGDIQADLPLQLTNAALATKNLNATLSLPPITASLPPATTIPTVPIPDYPLNSPHRTYNYSIPHTLTNLTLHLANPGQVPPIPSIAYAQTLLSLQRTARAEINSTGDRWLSAREEPFGWDVGLGCWVEFWSNPAKGVASAGGGGGRVEKQHLTLGVLGAVMEGLLQRLVYEGIYEFVYVEVFDGGWGLVGMGFVSASAVSADAGGRNGTAGGVGGVLDTLRIEGRSVRGVGQ